MSPARLVGMWLEPPTDRVAVQQRSPPPRSGSYPRAAPATESASQATALPGFPPARVTERLTHEAEANGTGESKTREPVFREFARCPVEPVASALAGPTKDPGQSPITLKEDDVMNTSTLGLNRIAAAACAAVITAVGALAFVSSTASSERDPFHFAAVMAANAQARSGSLLTFNTAPACWNEPVNSAYASSSPAHVCRRA
jgi:hypothetical protein